MWVLFCMYINIRSFLSLFLTSCGHLGIASQYKYVCACAHVCKLKQYCFLPFFSSVSFTSITCLWLESSENHSFQFSLHFPLVINNSVENLLDVASFPN